MGQGESRPWQPKPRPNYKEEESLKEEGFTRVVSHQ